MWQKLLLKFQKSLSFFFFSLFQGFEWVGWSNDSVGVPGKPVELTFQFDSVRNFSAMVLHTNNMFTKGVQVSLWIFNTWTFIEARRDQLIST